MARSDFLPSSQSSAHRVGVRTAARRTQESAPWLEEHKSQLLIGLGVVVGLLLCVLLIIGYSRYQTAAALEELRAGVAALHASQVATAIPHLEKASTRLGSGHGAALARFYLNEAYLGNGMPERAEQVVATMPGHASAHPDYLVQLLLLAQGRSAEKRSDSQGARKFYEDAAALEGPLGAEALLGVVRSAEAAGDGSTATSAREKFLAAYANSPFAELMRQQLGK